MSVKHSLLALLSEGPRYGAELRSTFEQRTGGTWPLNVGQVYTTLGRLERDGLVVREEASGDSDDTATIRYAVTPAGLAEVERWWTEPVDRASTPRQELAIKLALAVTVPTVDVPRLVQAQRAATMQHLQELTRLKRAERDPDLAWGLVLENLIFTAEAEVRWLDHVEARVNRAAAATPARESAPADSASGNRQGAGRGAPSQPGAGAADTAAATSRRSGR